MISEEIQLIKQNIYDLLHNTRINKKAYLIILIGLFCKCQYKNVQF